MAFMKIKVATYNIHKGVSYRSKPRVLALKQAIAAFDAELIFLQEVQGQHDRIAARFGEERHGPKHRPEGSQHEFFAGESHQSVYGLNAQYDHGHHGNALLSKYPIAKWTNTDISDHAYEARGILHSVVETPKGVVHCYVIHLGLFERSRVRQVEALIEAVKLSAPNNEPVIIAGDFNDWRNTLSAKLRKALGVVEVFDEIGAGSSLGDLVRTLARRQAAVHPARTFPSALPFFRLDRIYVRGFKVESAQVLHGPIWAKLSDHAPLTATLKLL
jgi:endonuclease/exonuclease/phosphatase family metal-dependent hydrolase